MEKWPALQEHLFDSLIEYYNEEERFSYGPEDFESHINSKKWMQLLLSFVVKWKISNRLCTDSNK